MKQRFIDDMTRRSAVTYGLAALAAAPIAAQSALAQAPGSGGVKRVQLGKYESMLPSYKSLSMRDVILQPGASTAPNNVMQNDMVCHCPEGEMRVVQIPGGEHKVKKGDVWACTKGIQEQVFNIGSGVAIMRIIDLLPT